MSDLIDSQIKAGTLIMGQELDYEDDSVLYNESDTIQIKSDVDFMSKNGNRIH